MPTLVVQHADRPAYLVGVGQIHSGSHTGREIRRAPRPQHATTGSSPALRPFQEIAEFLTGHQADVADDRVLATVLFTDIVDSTRRAAEMGDRDSACAARRARRSGAIATGPVSRA